MIEEMDQTFGVENGNTKMPEWVRMVRRVCGEKLGCVAR